MHNVATIVHAACEAFGYNEAQIIGTGRGGLLPDVRQAVIYMSYMRGSRKADIARFFGRYKSNVNYNIETFDGYLQVGDQKATGIVATIEEILKKQNDANED